jgi:hypothetical protein
MVHPQSGARCAIRDTRAAGAARYHWTVSVTGKPNPVAAGRTSARPKARSQAEAALADHTAAWRELPRDGNGGYG